jgi:hypothetical protein
MGPAGATAGGGGSDGLSWAAYPASLADGLGEGGEIIHARFRLGKLAVMADNVPTPRSGQPQGVPLTQVIGVRFAVGSQRPYHCGGIGIDKGERGNGRVGAPSFRTSPRIAHGLQTIVGLHRRVRQARGTPRWPG